MNTNIQHNNIIMLFPNIILAYETISFTYGFEYRGSLMKS